MSTGAFLDSMRCIIVIAAVLGILWLVERIDR